jgi:hypothetical protein
MDRIQDTKMHSKMEKEFFKSLIQCGLWNSMRRTKRLAPMNLNKLQRFPHIFMQFALVHTLSLRTMIQCTLRRECLSGNHWCRTWDKSWCLVSQRQLLISIRRLTGKDIHSQKWTMLCALTINMEQWRMWLALLTVMILCAPRSTWVFLSLHSSALSSSMSLHTCGLETWSPCNGGMIFG